MRHWKGVALGLAFVFLVPILISAASPRYGGTLRVATTSSPSTLDPIDPAVATREVGIHVFETLVAFNEDFEVVPELAESWEVSNGGLTYTFKLRQGVKFHNGKEMTASDVKASIERFMRVATRSSSLSALRSMEIIDENTLRLHLETRDGSFLSALASPLGRLAIMPEEVVRDAPRGSVDLVGTGPYYVEEWVPDWHTVIRRFEEYEPVDAPSSGFSGRKHAYLDEIVFIPVPDANARAIGLETGGYDFADFVPVNRVERLEALPNVTVTEIGPYAIFNAWINHASPRLGSDLKLRQAIQAGLDMEEMMLAASDGVGELNPGIHFKNQKWHSAAGEELYNQADFDKAKQLLGESNYNGDPLIILGANDYDYMYKGALNLASQLERMGIDTELMIADFAGIFAFALENAQGWDLLMMSHSTRFDPRDNVDQYFDPDQHPGRYQPDEELQSWILNGRRNTEMDERIPYYENIQQRMYDEVLLWYKFYDLYSHQAYDNAYVHGYEPWVMIHFFNTWVAD